MSASTMPKSLAKVQSKVIKKKGRNAALHEKSRDSQKLRRASARVEKLERTAAARAKTIQPLPFFQDAVMNATPLFDIELIHGLIQRFLSRSDDTLAEVEARRRPGRPSSTHEDLLKLRMAVEDKEYNSGFWMPDMTDSENVQRLQAWNGEWAHLNTLQYISVSRAGQTNTARWPPKM
ncbi:uncharacterized protein KY384_005930 [Bacidia gigantensis]|uniref:uncharacterized protein n=1 Tax=Bacidia gigantensis TaxID=2732470 RepID=UPI001D036485|nr:uncharacterized protein KY384_005930 [Bacidia gigantensis]KAG8529295.1 hypothetical protein KY384_005930 [Bacidia gigantensis]